MSYSFYGAKDLEHFIKLQFQDQIRGILEFPETSGSLEEIPNEMHPVLKKVFLDSGFRSLYSHQTEAFRSILSGKDTLIVSRTASGKTMSFLLPILNDYLNAKTPFTSLLLYPTKALSRDQEGTVGRLLHAALGKKSAGTYDGDTPREEREALHKQADFIISNPDMIHNAILPNHNRKWRQFLSRLKYIVVDEVHSYRGAFGSHVANVFRRLMRVCEVYGVSPIFIGLSATIGNPGGHARSLFGREFQVIERDGSPRPARQLFMINPPLVKSAGDALYRKGTSHVSIPLLRFAAKNNIRTICFCRARQEVERLYRAVTDGLDQETSEKIRPYRGGLLPTERRALEKALFSGEISAVITTNALELGIDVGELSLCILSGFPGTVASFWQQAGRVGRKGNKATIVFAAKDQPIDQYIVAHPEFITGAPIEVAWINPENPYIVLQHLPCAAWEYPLGKTDTRYDSGVYGTAVDVLRSEKTIVPYSDSFRYAREDYPTRGVNLRGMTDYNVEIYLDGKVIGELDPIGARGTLYKDAIYSHLGSKFMSMELDLEKKLCRVEKANVDYFTEAVWDNRITMLSKDEEKTHRDAKMVLGSVDVVMQPKLYKKIKEKTLENIGYGPITLDPFQYETIGFSLELPAPWSASVKKADIRFIEAGLYGLNYILKKYSGIFCMADPNDINTDVALQESLSNEFRFCLYVYDAHEGGVGYSEKIYEKIGEVTQLAEEILKDCECGSWGCPSCVPPVPPGIHNREMEELMLETNVSHECTRSLLQYMNGGELSLPSIKTRKAEWQYPVQNEKPDEEALRMKKKLERAAGVLGRKRQKLH